MSQAPDDPSDPPRRSASAEGAALRWAEKHPDEDTDHVAPQVPPPAEGVPNRHSASVEAAALRLREAEDEREAGTRGDE